ncbi:YidB family protein [Caviibacterium pharyngocola]|uniref:DUF937 domain-containing protein n=1 Tax=Caviibacterium pharyngocola TaxID=28159 RepID=A0A2M8RW68_9PAST|nr:YidB family protein [Caviibacterium pharyngocola]PJG83132.1 hypothetical protein CVP04_07210 [Caviibacterium pharyngocola]
MLDKVLGSVLNSVLNGGANSAGGQGSVAGQVLSELLRSQGGVEGIFGKLQQGGLDGILDSWIGTGKNQQLDRSQVSETFGRDTIDNIAQQTEISTNQTEDIISQVLPNLIDMLTPKGREGGVSADSLTQSAQQSGGLGDLLGGVLGNIFAEQKASSSAQQTQDNPFGEIFNQMLNTPTKTSQTAAPSNNDELAKDIGAILNNFFK